MAWRLLDKFSSSISFHSPKSPNALNTCITHDITEMSCDNDDEVMFHIHNRLHQTYRWMGMGNTPELRLNYLHLGQFGCGSAGHLSDTQTQQLILELIELLGQLLLLLCTQFRALDFHLYIYTWGWNKRRRHFCISNLEFSKA